MILEFNRLLKEKKISSKELTKKYLNAIKNVDDELNSYVTVEEEFALNSADVVDEKIKNNEEISPLEGIPFTLKDNISTKGIKTTCCSKILENYLPIYDAFVWERLKENNAILLGKANMDEFAMGSTCETSYFKGAKNPHNTKCVAGGSSGGVTAAVGAGIAAYGLGSDTGGSIRQPSSFCGVVGLKPTYGAVSRFGLIAFASSLDQVGPIATSAQDAALVYDEIALKDNKDTTSTGLKEKTFPHLNDEISGVKIGIAKEFFSYVDEEVKAKVDEAIKTYEKLGAKIVEISLPSLDFSLVVYYIIASAEASSNLGRYDGIRYGIRANSYGSIHEMICKTRSEGFGREVKRRILLGTYVLSSGFYDAYYKKANLVRGKIMREFKDAFKSCDVILTPTSPTTAFEAGYSKKDPVLNYMADICTVPVNIAGIPAISFPCGISGSNLPIGVQLIGPHFSEAKLLNMANIFEKETNRCYFKKVLKGVYPDEIWDCFRARNTCWTFN